MADDRLARQIAFLVEADKLKAVLRRTALIDGSRQENSAEHSWHLALAAVVMAEYAPAPVNLVRVLEMLAVHDLVEIDAGDTFAYDTQNSATKADREHVAAERIFAMLPPDQAGWLRALWDEFEEQATAESKFANAMDRLQPLLQNAFSGGGSWCNQNLTREQVLARMAPIKGAMPAVWPMIVDTIESFCASGVLKGS
jgi:putative hydrolases of HD superfamily